MPKCSYHNCKLDEAGECPQCEREIMGYGKFASSGYKAENMTKDVKRLMKRMGVGGL